MAVSAGHRISKGMRMLPALVVATIVAAMMLSSCEDEKKYYVKNVGNGERVPTMRTVNVKTFISDSGYTKYYITAPTWDMYEEAKEPFWMFRKGIELEQYDDSMKVVATMRCDSAKYLSQRRLWRLDGHVVMVNVRKDTFLTKQLYWDQQQREVYSDSFIHIVRENRIIEGKGFVSNENMTAYSVKNPQGIFPVKKDITQPSSAPADDDNALYDEGMNRTIAPTRASAFGRSGSASGPMRHDTIPMSMQNNTKTKVVTTKK